MEIEKLKKVLNLNYTDVTNKMHKIGKYDIPYVECNLEIFPDYLALFTEKRLYKKTDKTAVCFYVWDDKFDGFHGLWNAIYYNKENLLNKFRNRFSGVKIAIAPDYSLCEDTENFENYYRIAKARVVSGWLTLECGIAVIPNLTFSRKEDFEIMIMGMENVNTICVSLKGSCKNPNKKSLLIEAINYAVDNLKQLKNIIVYSVSGDSEEEVKREYFNYPILKGINVVIPNNTLRTRNQILKGGQIYGPTR